MAKSVPMSCKGELTVREIGRILCVDSVRCPEFVGQSLAVSIFDDVKLTLNGDSKFIITGPQCELIDGVVLYAPTIIKNSPSSSSVIINTGNIISLCPETMIGGRLFIIL